MTDKKKSIQKLVGVKPISTTEISVSSSTNFYKTAEILKELETEGKIKKVQFKDNTYWVKETEQ